MKNYVVVDAINEKLLMTKKDYNAAKKGYGDAYEALCDKMTAHPSFTVDIIIRQTHIEGDKRTYKGLSIAFMSNYIAALGVDDDIKEFESAQKYAKNRKMKVFAFTKKWFLDKYATEGKPFDMENAANVIFEYQKTVIKGNLEPFSETNTEQNTTSKEMKMVC